MGTRATERPPASSEFPDGKPLNILSWPEFFNPPDGMFAPGDPLWPIIQEPIRTFDFRVGQNTILQPRIGEVRTFAELRAFSNVELVRLAIETRKDQIEKLDWQIKPKEKTGGGVRKDSKDRIKAATKFLNKPDGVNDFHEWLHLVLEDLFTIDAPCIERRRTKSGNIVGYDVVPGDTIKVLVDYNGRLPRPPAPAYQQIIKGRVWCDLTTDDIIYKPRNRRPNHLYGFSPVEQILVTIHTVMLRQASQLSYFTEGNVPAGLAGVPDVWTVDQIKEWQDWMDAKFSGNLGERRKLLWAPAGSKYQPFKDSPIKDEFDEWLARVTCYAFSLPPTAFIKQLNRSASQADQERAIDEGQAPLKSWCKRLIDGILVEIGFPELQFDWIKEQEVDPGDEATININYLKAGVLTLNEVRDEIGLEPIKDGDETLIYNSTGAITLENVLNPPLPIPGPAGPAGVPKIGVPGSASPSGKPAAKPAANAAKPAANTSRPAPKNATKVECDAIANYIDELLKRAA